MDPVVSLVEALGSRKGTNSLTRWERMAVWVQRKEICHRQGLLRNSPAGLYQHCH